MYGAQQPIGILNSTDPTLVWWLTSYLVHSLGMWLQRGKQASLRYHTTVAEFRSNSFDLPRAP